ncbi:MAG TPA: hypothetical protein VKB09_11465, partial [Thermomicrobiales bacterium]|nr:hypothetical protein [Thermomicrobiales bacterium]
MVASLAELARHTGRAIATRCPEATLDAVIATLSGEFDVSPEQEASSVVVARRRAPPPRTGGRIAVITAGSSDARVAAETA